MENGKIPADGGFNGKVNSGDNLSELEREIQESEKRAEKLRGDLRAEYRHIEELRAKYRNLKAETTSSTNCAPEGEFTDGGFILDGNTLTGYCGNSENVVIPAGVTKIGDGAFYKKEKIKSVVIPQGVCKIGAHAFEGCSGLREITVPKSLQYYGFCAFSSCYNLKRINYVGKIQNWCRTTFFSNPLCHGASLYINGEHMKRIVIPCSITEINANAFEGCDAEEIILHDGITKIGNYAFASTKIGNIVIMAGTKIIEYSAFDRCKNLQEVTIESGVQKLGDTVFSNCKALKTVRIPASVKIVGDRIFNGCNSVTVSCEAKFKPAGWNNDWNKYGYGNDRATVYWGEV